MPVPARLIRRHCDDMQANRPPPCHKEDERRTCIMDSAQAIMALYGRAAIRLTDFACGLRMAPVTVRRHFPDMDNLLAAILSRHLMAIANALGGVPHTPDRPRALREAYLAYTRTPFGAPTEAHLLLIRERHLLPPDEYEPLEALRLTIGDIVAGPHAKTALALLDTPELALPAIEAALAALDAPAQPAPQPQPRPQGARPRLVHPLIAAPLPPPGPGTHYRPPAAPPPARAAPYPT